MFEEEKLVATPPHPAETEQAPRDLEKEVPDHARIEREYFEEKMVEEFGYDPSELEQVQNIWEDKEKKLTYVELTKQASMERLKHIHSAEASNEEIRYAMRYISRAFENAGMPLYIAGSNAHLLETPNSAIGSKDIDAVFIDFDEERMGNLLQFLMSQEGQDGPIEKLHLGEDGGFKRHPATGAIVVELDLRLADGRTLEIECFGQNPDPEKAPQGIVNLGFNEYAIHEYRDDNTELDQVVSGDLETVIRTLDRNALVEWYAKSLFLELNNFNYKTYENKSDIKLKHSARLAKLYSYGIQTQEQVEEIVQYYVSSDYQMPVPQETLDNFLQVLGEVRTEFEKRPHVVRQESSISVDMVRRDDVEHEFTTRAQQLEYAAEIMSQEAAKDIKEMHNSHISIREAWRGQFMEGIRDKQNDEPLSDEDLDWIEEIIPNMTPEWKQEKMDFIERHLGEINKYEEDLQVMRSKYQEYLGKGLAEDEFNLFTIVHKTDKYFVQRIESLIGLYRKEMVYVRSILEDHEAVAASRDPREDEPDAPSEETMEKAAAGHERMNRRLQEKGINPEKLKRPPKADAPDPAEVEKKS